MSQSLPTPSIVVGIDGSKAAANAATWAALEAGRRDLPLRLVHVIHESAADAALAGPDLGVEYAETVLREVDAAVHAQGPGSALASEIKVETAILHGSPGPSLIDESRGSAMICVGSVGIGRFSRALFGSTATELAHGAHCPVAVIRADRPSSSTTGWIAVAVKHTADDDVLLEHAFREAQLRDAPVLALESQPWRRVGRHDLRVEQWGSRYPDVRIRLTPLRLSIPETLCHIGEPIELAVISPRDVDAVSRIVGPVGPRGVESNGTSVLVVRDSPV